MKWIVQDWAGNHMFPALSFDTYMDAWDHVYQHSPEECWEDIYVVPSTTRSRGNRLLHLTQEAPCDVGRSPACVT